MPTAIDFVTVSTAGLESSPHADALAGLRANEARYFKNKYDIEFFTEPASEKPEIVDYVSRVLNEREIVIASTPLEVTEMMIDAAEGRIRWTYVFYQSGLVINVLYTMDNAKKRAVGFKLSMGMDIPDELADKFKFARQKSKLAGEIRGSFFVVKKEYA
ncbi:MAG: phage tail protein [Microbacteriaceae bacterium]|nr:phage tail protein [Microbacteriaceae bacterium]